MPSDRRRVHAKREGPTTRLLGVSFAGERAFVLGDFAVEVEAVAAPALSTGTNRDVSSQRRGAGITVKFLESLNKCYLEIVALLAVRPHCRMSHMVTRECIQETQS